MDDAARPVLVVVTAHDGESLPSIIQRSAQVNDHHSVYTIFVDSQWQFGWTCMRNLLDTPDHHWLIRLADHLSQPHWIIELGTRRRTTMGSLRNYQWPATARMMTYCPLCLIECPAWMTAWQAPHVVACERHQVLLVDHYDTCVRRPKAQRRWFAGTGPVTTCSNRSCRPLTETEPEPASDELIELQQQIVHHDLRYDDAVRYDLTRPVGIHQIDTRRFVIGKRGSLGEMRESLCSLL